MPSLDASSDRLSMVGFWLATPPADGLLAAQHDGLVFSNIYDPPLFGFIRGNRIKRLVADISTYSSV